MRSLIFWGGGTPSDARAKLAAGAEILLWNEADAEELRKAGIAFRAASDLLSVEDADRADAAAIRWTKDWGKRPLVDGKSFRQLLEWKGVALWWFAELYLHHSTPSTHYVRLIETFHRLLEILQPEEVEAVSMDAPEAVLLGRACNARRVLFHGPRRLSVPTSTLGVLLESRWNTLKAFVSASKARMAAAPIDASAPGRGAVLFLSHAAFWKERTASGDVEPREYEHYFDRLIPAVANTGDLRPVVVAVGPRHAFRRRGVRERLREWLSAPGGDGPYLHVNSFASFAAFRSVKQAAAVARRAWRMLETSPAMHAAFSHREVPFFDLSKKDLAQTLLLQLPWAVRSYEEAAAVIARLRPQALCLYAESSGWGRAAVAAARAAGIPSLAIQHGILYPTYYSYLHDHDEGACPRPDRTAVFGEAARRFLLEQGHYAPDSLVVTGSPKFDELLQAARTWDRALLRRDLGVADGERLILVASRFRGIRRTHQSIGSGFASLLLALGALPDAQLLVKPHPAEPAASYQALIQALAASRARVLPPSADLVKLLHACDVLVTVESLSAVEALVLDRPVVILNMPTNIREMVEAGVALGVPKGADPGPALRAALDDPATRDALANARVRYLDSVAKGVDGQATARILDLLRQTIALGGRGARESEPSRPA